MRLAFLSSSEWAIVEDSISLVVSDKTLLNKRFGGFKESSLKGGGKTRYKRFRLLGPKRKLALDIITIYYVMVFEHGKRKLMSEEQPIWEVLHKVS